MAKKPGYVTYTSEELAKLPTETDWAKVDATTEEEIERQAEEDERELPEEWDETD